MEKYGIKELREYRSGQEKAWNILVYYWYSLLLF